MPQEVKRQLRILIALRALRMFMITMPVIVLYWQDHGLNMQDIFVLQVIYSIAVVILEVPSGYFADRFGYRLSLILGSFACVIGFWSYANIPTYLGFLTAELLLAFSASFYSGAREALLYNTLASINKESSYQEVQSLQILYGNLSEATAAILAGVTAWYLNIEAVFHIQWIIVLAAIPLSFLLYDVGQVKKPPNLLAIVKTSVTSNRQLFTINIISGAVAASTLSMVWFAQPLWESLGVPLALFGLLWAGLNVFSGLCGQWSIKLQRQIGYDKTLVVLALSPLVLYTIMSVVSNQYWLALAAASLFWGVRGVAIPFFLTSIQALSDGRDRATLLSINSLYGRLIFAGISPFLGTCVDWWSFGVAFGAAAVIYGSIALIACGFYMTRQYRQ